MAVLNVLRKAAHTVFTALCVARRDTEQGDVLGKVRIRKTGVGHC